MKKCKCSKECPLKNSTQNSLVSFVQNCVFFLDVTPDYNFNDFLLLNRPEQIQSYHSQTFVRAISLACLIGFAKNECTQPKARSIQKQLETLFFIPYQLNRIATFTFNVFPQKVFVIRLLQFQAILILFEFLKLEAFQRKMFILQMNLSKGAKRLCRKHRFLIKVNASTDALTTTCRNLSEQIFLRTPLDSYFLQAFALSIS